MPPRMTAQCNRSINDTRRVVRGRRIAQAPGLVPITITSTVATRLSTSTWASLELVILTFVSGDLRFSPELLPEFSLMVGRIATVLPDRVSIFPVLPICCHRVWSVLPDSWLSRRIPFSPVVVGFELFSPSRCCQGEFCSPLEPMWVLPTPAWRWPGDTQAWRLNVWSATGQPQFMRVQEQ